MDECFDSMDRKTQCYCSIFTVSIVLLTSYVAFSFGAIEPTEYAITYNYVSKNIDTDILEGGLQFVGLTNHLVKYPKIMKTVEFSDDKNAQAPGLATRTSEGLELTLYFAFQYQIWKEQIPNLYRLCEQEYEELYILIAKNTILLEAGQFAAPMYWQNRTYVGNQMLLKLNEALNQAFANCTGFMFLRIDLPDPYENAIVQTQVVNQQKNTQEAIKNSTLIRTQIEVDRSNAQMKVDIINAQADSEALIIANVAKAQMLKNSISSQNWAYNGAMKKVNFTNSQTLLDYIFYVNLMNLNKLSDTKLLVGLDSALINFSDKPIKNMPVKKAPVV